MSLSLRQVRDSVIIVILCALLVIAGLILKRLPSSADRGLPPRPPEHFERMMEEQLGLTDAQKKQLKEHRSADMEEARQLFNRLFDAQEAVMEEFKKEPLDTAAIDRLQTNVKAVLSEIEDHRLKKTYELRKILTPEQFSKLHQKMEELHRQHRAFFPPPPPLGKEQ